MIMRKLSSVIIAIAVVICLTSLSIMGATLPHLKCFGTLFYDQCNESCNCEDDSGSCCWTWVYSGTCNSCLNWYQNGYDSCSQASPTFKSGNYKYGDCAYKFEIEYTSECVECDEYGNWNIGTKICHPDCS